MKVTVKSVAEKAGTSLATVSRYLNQSGYVSKAVGDRIQEAIDDLGYEPKGIARVLLTQSRKNIGILVSDLRNMFYPPVIMGIEDELERSGFNALLCITYDSTEKELKYLNTLVDKRADAFIMIGSRPHNELNEQIVALARDYPVVLLNDYLLGSEAYSIMSDEVEGAFFAAQHLIELGHTRIAFLNGSSDLTTFRLKESGFRRAIEEHDMAIPNGYYVATTADETGGHHSATHLLALPEPPTAIFAASDQMAIGVLRAAAEAGFSVPTDLSVVGFSNIPVSQELHPPLTTVDQQPYELGRIAAETVIRALSGENLKQKRVILQPTFLGRQTCAPPVSR